MQTQSTGLGIEISQKQKTPCSVLPIVVMRSDAEGFRPADEVTVEYPLLLQSHDGVTNRDRLPLLPPACEESVAGKRCILVFSGVKPPPIGRSPVSGGVR